jgi:hypothetical protein
VLCRACGSPSEQVRAHRVRPYPYNLIERGLEVSCAAGQSDEGGRRHLSALAAGR